MKNKLWKKFVAGALIVMMGIGAVGCSDGSSKGSPQASQTADKQDTAKPDQKKEEPKERTKLKVMSWWDITKSDSLKQLKEQFEAQNPDIELEFTMVGKGYADKIVTIIAGGGDAVPDVMMLAMDLVPKFARTNNIMVLDEYVTKEYKDSLYPMVSNACSVDGKLYAVARDVSSMAMYLNKKMFEEAGIPIPTADWTIDDFLSIAQKLTKVDSSEKPVQWGYYFPKYPDTIYDWIISEGGRYVSEDGTKSLMTTPETQKGLQFMYDLIYKYKVCPTEAQAKQFGDKVTSALTAGKVGMQIGALSMENDLKGATPPIDYAVVPLPKKDGKQFTHAFVNTWTIPKGAKHPELSWRVLEFFSGKEGQQIALDYKMGLPASKLVDTKTFVAESPYNQIFIDSLNYAVPFETYQYGAEFNEILKKELEPLWLGTTTVDGATKAIDQSAAQVLKGNK